MDKGAERSRKNGERRDRVEVADRFGSGETHGQRQQKSRRRLGMLDQRGERSLV